MVDRSRIKTYSLKERPSLVSLADIKALGPVENPLNTRDFRELVERIKTAKNNKRPYPTHEITTANFDQITHYRLRMNIVERPTAHGGKGYNFQALHQQSIPSLWMASTND
jgi:hypothetical protein